MVPTSNPNIYELKELPLERDYREVGDLAVWTVTSAKLGNGVEQLRDGRTDTYWQSDGLQPHLINVQFQKRVTLTSVAIRLDYKLDESYTPNKIVVRTGTSHADLKEIETVTFNEPNGWQHIPLKAPNQSVDYLKAWLLQLAVISNHQNGRDTHVRQIKVFGPRHIGVKAIGHDIAFTSAEFAPYAVVR